MTDEILIEKYLNKNLKITTSEIDFSISDVVTNKVYHSPTDYKYDFQIVFPGEESEKIFINWFENQKSILAKRLSDYLDSMDGKKYSSDYLFDAAVKEFDMDETYKLAFIHNYFSSYYEIKFLETKISAFLSKLDYKLGSEKLMSKLLRKFKGDLLFYSSILINKFDENYRENYLTPEVDKYISSLTKNINSKRMLDGFSLLILENVNHKQYACDRLNDWYSSNVLDDKLEDLISQFVLTLGRRNWIVTWIGHGPVDEDKIMRVFNEDDYHRDYVMKKFDRWYENAVIDASERAITNNFL